MRLTPIKPMQVTVKQPLFIRILKWVGIATAYLLFAVFFAVIIIEWMAGCGESYVAYDGVRHMHECVFITPYNYEPNLN